MNKQVVGIQMAMVSTNLNSRIIFSNGVKNISLPFNRFVTMGLAKRIMLQAQGKNFQTNTARQ